MKKLNVLIAIIIFLFFSKPVFAQYYNCGDTMQNVNVDIDHCTCTNKFGQKQYTSLTAYPDPVTSCCGWYENGSCVATDPDEEPVQNTTKTTSRACGESYVKSSDACNCPGGDNRVYSSLGYQYIYCCGWVNDGQCSPSKPTPPDSGPIAPGQPVTSETLDSLNPLKLLNSSQQDNLKDPGSIISRLLKFAFPIAGLILFVMLVWGGFEMLVSSTNKANIDAGKQRITAAIVGFIILFCAYWIAQILEAIFNISILG
jgi:hypothetical protein